MLWGFGLGSLSGCHDSPTQPTGALPRPRKGALPLIWQLALPCPEDHLAHVRSVWAGSIPIHSFSAVPSSCLVKSSLLQHSNDVHKAAAPWLCTPGKECVC